MKELQNIDLINLDGGHCPPDEEGGFFYTVGYAIGTVLMWFEGDVNIN